MQSLAQHFSVPRTSKVRIAAMATPRFAKATAVLSCLVALATLASCNTEGKLHIYHIAGIVTELSLFF